MVSSRRVSGASRRPPAGRFLCLVLDFCDLDAACADRLHAEEEQAAGRRPFDVAAIIKLEHAGVARTEIDWTGHFRCGNGRKVLRCGEDLDLAAFMRTY